MAKSPGKAKKKTPFFAILRLLLVASLLAATGIDWYIVFLLSQSETNFWRVRKMAGIAGGFLISLMVLILVVVIGLMFTGAGAVLFKGGIGSIDFFVSVIFFIFIGCVMGINFAIMPIAKDLGDQVENAPPQTVEFVNQSEQKDKLFKLAIAGAGFGTGLIALFIFYYMVYGLIASKKRDKDDLQDKIQAVAKVSR